MSFIITVYTNEGIVMASDSRTTYTTTHIGATGAIEKEIGVQITDTTNKTFLTANGIGISTCGDATINNLPIAGYIEDYIAQKTNNESSVKSVSEGLIGYFSEITSRLDTIFIVAGYEKGTNIQMINRISTVDKSILPVDTTESGAIWNGEIDTLQKLINCVALKTKQQENGVEVTKYNELPYFNLGFNFFTLQDAIDFAEYAVDVTIKTMQFQHRVKTVGGPIDILVIRPNGAEWIAKKKLHA